MAKSLKKIQQVTLSSYTESTKDDNTLYFVRNSDSASNKFGSGKLFIGGKQYGESVKLPKTGYKYLSGTDVSDISEALTSLDTAIENIDTGTDFGFYDQ